jgi:hypothetical protein
VRTALLVCGDCEMASQFRIGVDLMIRGLDAYLQPWRKTQRRRADPKPLAAARERGWAPSFSFLQGTVSGRR